MVVVVVAADATPAQAEATAGDGAGRMESTVDGAFERIPVGDTKSGQAVKCCVAPSGTTPIDANQLTL